MTARISLTDSDLEFIKNASLEELREALYYARGYDAEYEAALAKEIVSRGLREYYGEQA